MKAFEYAAPAQRARGARTAFGRAGQDRSPGRRHRPGRPDEEDDRHARPRGEPGPGRIAQDDRGRLAGRAHRRDGHARRRLPTIRPRATIRRCEQAIRAIGSLQLQSQGTLGGELCQRPRCWYFRDGDGLLADRGRAVAEGDNRYHAIFGNAGPAKFVCPSRLAPALIALGATRARDRPRARRRNDDAARACCSARPSTSAQREHDLLPNQIVAHIVLPPAGEPAQRVVRSAARQRARLSAGRRGRVAGDPRRRVVPTRGSCWARSPPRRGVSSEAADAIVGRPVNEETAAAAGDAAVSVATPLAHNEYKVQLAKVAVKRALLRPPDWKREASEPCPTRERSTSSTSRCNRSVSTCDRRPSMWPATWSRPPRSSRWAAATAGATIPSTCWAPTIARSTAASATPPGVLRSHAVRTCEPNCNPSPSAASIR